MKEPLQREIVVRPGELAVATQVSCVSSVSEKCIVRLVSDSLGMSYARSLGAQGAYSAEMHQRLFPY